MDVNAYPFFILLAALAGVATLIGRTRRREIDVGKLVPGFIIAIVAGWLAGRIVHDLSSGSSPRFEWALLSPFARAPYSISIFLAFSSVILFSYVLFFGSKSLTYLDALAPSIFISIAVAKFACLSSGCCAGIECRPAVGITYPFGSIVYNRQYALGMLDPPDPLLLSLEDGKRIPICHVALLAMDDSRLPLALKRHLVTHGMTREEALLMAQKNRTMPVFPLPIAYTTAGLVLWVTVEIFYRCIRAPGATFALTFVLYGLMRVVLDAAPLVEANRAFGLSTSQWIGVGSLIVGGLVGTAIWFKRNRPQMGDPREPGQV
ncbi:MAG: hypothetical protein AMXMBFR84_22320 [Candidatus Hydrogenedentota bacterium]